ncbi:MAG: pyridoxamine 5'-phosphate oxidase family protein [Nitrospirae bacterium]|nr:pyridoxamine 5'-phosphate oxidase family protein [Nitrospirota bacterium]MBF0542677.1 pyridoxamine 5'-phosphate oxidase family protein [Nitrospirota bacterium]
MGKQYDFLTDEDIEFIKFQKVFFIASASGKEVNLSPKGYDSLRVLDNKSILFLDYPGSGDRTARDIRQGGDVTLMFTAFTGKPSILRLFCKGQIIEKTNQKIVELLKYFTIFDVQLIRRLLIFEIYTVERSCGKSVPIMNFISERRDLIEAASKLRDIGTLEKFISDHKTPPILNRKIRR